MYAQNTHQNVPLPVGAIEVSDWMDSGTPEPFRLYSGPTWTIEGSSATVTVRGTQLADGTIEEREIKIGGSFDTLTAEEAEALAKALAQAASLTR